jgi:murein DD-endopeptidase MepM/ murein hydrolase activator NlpD
VRSKASAETITLPVTAANVPVADVTPSVTGAGPFFPILGAYKFGTGTAAFGGARHHQGQDVFAKCGTPLVAAEGGTVVMNAFQSKAGNYLAVAVDGGTHSEAYMHLKAPALPPVGTHVDAGAPIGQVGDTGDADGCHLHFEYWIGHWQGVGGAGTVVDPLPYLKAWAALPKAVPAVAVAATTPAVAARATP